MNAPVTFAMPPEEDPELGTPHAIEHGCDYMLLPDGKIEYYYNFLIYKWQIGDEVIEGRAYLDEPGRVSVFTKGTRLQQEPALQPIVRYLQRRFVLIDSFHPDDAGTDGTHNAVFRHHLLKDDDTL